MKKIFKYILALSIIVVLNTSCEDFLEQNPDNILTNEDVFSDWNMVQSVLANYYGRALWGQHLTDDFQYIFLDEACNSSGGPDNTQNFGDAHWRVYDYGLIRNINQFLYGVRSDAASGMSASLRNQAEGEARFLRAWTYFNMARGLGGIPIVGDEVFEYNAGMDISPLQIPRSTEAEIYDYIIKECTEIFELLPKGRTTNSARANAWTALALKARAAIYAGSLARYNNLMNEPIRLPGGEVGIPANKAQEYYNIALTTSQKIIAESGYGLYNRKADKGINFYEAVSLKDNNNEVMWSRDYKYPGNAHQFTTRNIPRSVREDMDGTIITPILNLVEAFEYTNNRNGALITTTQTGEYVFYNNPRDIFANKDPRLDGTVIYPGSMFKGKEISFQAGRKFLQGGTWANEIATFGTLDAQGNVITSENGPTTTNDMNVNKTGFGIRKFLDETVGAGTRGRGSEMWFVNFRYAEILLIAAEAAMELSRPEAVAYINQVRSRAGIQPLTSVTLEDIMQERRVELAFENHRFWDLKRWRRAHLIWNGIADDPQATHYALFPYKVNQPGHIAHGKWVFDKRKAHMSVHPRFFRLQNYYNFLDQGWINNNPKLVKNPFQP